MSAAPALLPVLHALRVRGVADAGAVAARARLPRAAVEDMLLDAEAAGLVARVPFAGPQDWSLTERGTTHGEALLASELDALGARPVVRDVLDGFGPLNDLVTGACTRWQLTELGLAGPPAAVADVLRDLTRAAGGLAATEARLADRLPRFAGYHARFVTALDLARDDTAWIAGIDRDSAHRVWFELHEDLLATLGARR